MERQQLTDDGRGGTICVGNCTGGQVRTPRTAAPGRDDFVPVDSGTVETFFAQVEAETGTGLPDFVKDKFDAFLVCGSPPMVFCACVAKTAPMISSWPSLVNGAEFARLWRSVYGRDNRPPGGHVRPGCQWKHSFGLVSQLLKTSKAGIHHLRLNGRFWPTAGGQATWAGLRPLGGRNRSVTVLRLRQFVDLEVYDHRKKAGNRGDVVKHPALMAALDTVITVGVYRGMRYADLFAGYAYTILQPGGEWVHGIGALRGDLARTNSPHLKGWLSRYLSQTQIIGSPYPGSSLIASDVAAAHNCRLEMTLWDTSPAVCDDLTSFYAGTRHRTLCREATVLDSEIRSADFLFLDPPGLRTRLKPQCPTWEWILKICFIVGVRNVLIWLPLEGETDIVRRTDYAALATQHGLSSTTVHWTKKGSFIGCQLLYRLPDAATNALRVTVEEVAKIACWQGQTERLVSHLNAY